MKMKNSVAAVAGIALLAAGYVGGAYFGWPGQDDELLGGNIGKANLFNSQEPDPEILAYQEALQTDSALQQKAVVSAILLSSRVDQLDSLADASIAATEGIAELADANAELKALKRKTTNAKKSYDALMQQTEVVLKGGKSETYEQASNNALLAFTILDNEILECRTMVDKMAEFIEENENENISNALGGWITYCAEDAALNANAERLEFWNNAMAAVSALPTVKFIFNKVTLESALGNSFSRGLKNKMSFVSLEARNVAALNNVSQVAEHVSAVLNNQGRGPLRNRTQDMAVLGNRAGASLSKLALLNAAGASYMLAIRIMMTGGGLQNRAMSSVLSRTQETASENLNRTNDAAGQMLNNAVNDAAAGQLNRVKRQTVVVQ